MSIYMYVCHNSKLYIWPLNAIISREGFDKTRESNVMLKMKYYLSLAEAWLRRGYEAP